MKVCIYLELGDKLKISGIGASAENQRKALRNTGIKITSNPNEKYDILDINTIGPQSLVFAKKAKKDGKKVVIHAHTFPDDFRESFRGSNFLARFLEKYLPYLYNQADLIITPSVFRKHQLKKMLGAKKNIRVVSNGVDLEKFQFSEKKRERYREKFSIEGVSPYSVGQVFIRKGINTFVNVAKKMNGNFFWFGPIPHRLLCSGGTRKVMKQCPLNVRFTGYVGDIVAAHSAGDVFFFPTFNESQGMAILEAGACKKPLVIRDLPVFEGWLKNGRNCLKAKTDEEFRKCLEHVIENEKERKRLAENAYMLAQQHSLERIGDELIDAYMSIL